MIRPRDDSSGVAPLTLTGHPSTGSRPSRAARLAVVQRRRALRRRFYVLTAASTVVPGAGLLGTKARRLGVLLTAVAAVVATSVLVLSWRNGVVKTVLSLAVRPGQMRLLIVGVLLGALLWALAILLTAGQTRPLDGQGRWLRTGFVLCCCLVVLAPSAVAARYLAIQSNLVDSVFGGGGGSIAAADAPDPWASTPRVNVLLLGSDAGTDRIGTRTDSMMVASIDTHTGDTVLIGIPRNLENVPIPASNPLSTVWPNGYNCGDQCLMNAIWTEAENHKDLFPQGEKDIGLRSTRDVISAVLDLPIQRTVVIDLRGFQSLVDAMGGVEVNVKERVCMNCKKGVNGGIVWTAGKEQYIEPGLQHLDGVQALWYARSRAQSDDFDRMRRQRCVVGALIRQANPANLLQRYPALAAAVKDNLAVDVPQSELPAWVELVTRIQQHGTIRSLPITDKVTPPGNPDFAKIRSLVQAAFHPQTIPTSSPTPSSGTPSTHPSGTPSSSAPADDSLASLATAC